VTRRQECGTWHLPSSSNGCSKGWLVPRPLQSRGSTGRKPGFCHSSRIFLLQNGGDFTCHLEKLYGNGRLSNSHDAPLIYFPSVTSPTRATAATAGCPATAGEFSNPSKKRKCLCKCPFNSHCTAHLLLSYVLGEGYASVCSTSVQARSTSMLVVSFPLMKSSLQALPLTREKTTSFHLLN